MTGKIAGFGYKIKIFYKKWNIHLYMSFFFCIFAAEFIVCVQVCLCMHVKNERNDEEWNRNREGEIVAL